MSADGTIDIAVRAEGTDEAAAELSEADGGGGGGDGRQGGSLSQRLGRGGAIGIILSQVLGPILDVLGPMLGILRAALAPLAIMLLRLAQPFLRMAIQLLPRIFDLFQTVGDILRAAQQIWFNFLGGIWNAVQNLPRQIWNVISGAASWLANGAVAIGNAVWSAISSGAEWFSDGAASIGEAVWNATTTTLGDIVTGITNLPSNIGQALAERLPNVRSLGGGDDTDPNRGAVTPASGALEREGGVQINLSGGLDSFVERIERSDVELP